MTSRHERPADTSGSPVRGERTLGAAARATEESNPSALFSAAIERATSLSSEGSSTQTPWDASDDHVQFAASVPEILREILAAAVALEGAKTLKDALSLDLASLAEEVGIGDQLALIDLRPLVANFLHAYDIATAAEAALASLPHPRLRTIVIDRLWPTEKATLEELGRVLGVTRERVRQLELRVATLLDGNLEFQAALDRVCGMFRRRVGDVAPIDEFRANLRGFVATAGDGRLCEALSGLLTEVAGYVEDPELGLAMTRRGRDRVSQLRERFVEAMDDEGLVSEARTCELLDGTDLSPELVGLTPMGDYCGLRDTVRARARAGLLTLHRPGTYEEIAAAAGTEPSRTLTNAVGSFEDVVRAGKTRWGLASWVEDVYQGIPAEIDQRIRAAGGWVSLDWLVDDITRRFGVAESSVRSYALAPRYVIEGGSIRFAEDDEREVDIQLPEDDSNAILLGNVWAYRFEVADHHLRGFSVQIPRWLAKQAGVDIGERAEVPLRDEPSHAVSVIWRDNTTTRPELGRLSPALARQRVEAGQEVAVLVTPEHCRLFPVPPPSEVAAHDRVEGDDPQPTRSMADLFAEEARRARRGLDRRRGRLD